MKTNPPLKLLIITFIICISGYLFTLNPALFRNDSPETITGCITLGITHPPGYPLFNLLGRCFYPLAVGNPAFTYNFMSALLASIGVCLLFINLWVLLSNIPSSNSEINILFNPKSVSCFTASLLFAFSNGYWGNAIAAKGGIYIFQMVLELTFFLLFQIITFKEKSDLFDFYFLSLLLLIGFANHWPSQTLLIPGILLVSSFQFQSWAKNNPLTILKTAATCATLASIVFSLYLYLPLRAHLYPALNFDAPFTWNRFIAAILRSDYSKIETMTSYRTTFLSVFNQKSAYISQHLFSEFYPPIYAFVVIGIFRLNKTNKKLTLFCLTLFSTVIWANLLYLQVSPIEFWHMDDHLLSINWILGLLTGMGIHGLLKTLAKLTLGFKKNVRIAATILVIFLAPISFFHNFIFNNQINEFLYYGYGLNALKSTTKNTLYFAESDYDYFSVLYLKTVLNKRSDVHLFLTLFLNKPYERELIGKTDPTLLISTTPKNEKSVLFDLVQNNYKSHPIFSTFSNASFSDLYLKSFSFMNLMPSGILTHIIQPNEVESTNSAQEQLEAFWNEYLQPEIENPSPIQGILRQACANPYLNAAQYEKLQGNLTNWDWYYSRAVNLISDKNWLAQTWFDRAEGNSISGDKRQALQSYQIAAYCFTQLGQMAKAKTAQDKAKALTLTH
jgi:hypothetical protein